MALQARAEVTRQTILAAATEVIGEVGYLNTSLSEVIDRAGVTKGAFYYHFPTKESLAGALADAADEAIVESARGVCLSSPAPALEHLVRAAFVVADHARNDIRIRIGIQLRQAMNHAAGCGDRWYGRQRALAIDVVTAAVKEGDLRADLDTEEVGHVLWIALLSAELHGEGMNRTQSLSCVLRTVLRGICTERSAPFFEQFVARVAEQYAAPA